MGNSWFGTLADYYARLWVYRVFAIFNASKSEISMLQSMLKSLQLEVLEEKALPAVWQNSDNSFAAGVLFKLLLQEGSVLRYYFNLDAADVTSTVNSDTIESVNDLTLCHVIRLIAIKHGHRSVNEVHVLAALFQLFPNGFDQQLERLQSLRMENMRKTIRDAASERTIQSGGSKLAKLAARLGPNIRDRPFGRNEVNAMLVGYLDSPYFPFTVNDWNEYMRMESKGPSLRRNIALECFASHWRRDKHLLR